MPSTYRTTDYNVVNEAGQLVGGLKGIFDIIGIIGKGVSNNFNKQKHNTSFNYSSIASATKDLTMSCPVLCSDTIHPETAQMIVKAIERNNISMLQMLIGAYKINANSGIEAIKMIHTNMDSAFKAEDLGADVAKSIDRYYMVVDSTIELLLRQNKYGASKKGLRATPLWNGHVQYIRVDNLCLGIYFNRELWKKDSSVYTPFWLSMNDSSWKQSEFVIAYLNSLPAQLTDRNHNGHLFVALDAPAGCTLEETANILTTQVLKHVEACKEFMK